MKNKGGSSFNFFRPKYCIFLRVFEYAGVRRTSSSWNVFRWLVQAVRC